MTNKRRMLIIADRFSIGALDLAAFYEIHGFKVDCVLTERLDQVKQVYDIVGLSFFGFDKMGVRVSIEQLVGRLKQLSERFPKAELWLGGRALSLLPESALYTLRHDSGCDVICVGDGEQLVYDYYVNFDNYPAWTPRHVKQMSGRDIQPTVVTVQSARGCPYSCNFCHQPQRLSFFTPERTAWNIKLVNDSIKFPMIVDDIFTLRADRMEALRVEMDRLKVPYKNRIRFFTHVRHRNEAEIAALVPDEVQLGIESGDDRMLSLMNKKITCAETRDAVVRLDKAVPGRLVGLFLLGYPGENEESLKNTLEFVRETRQCYKHIWLSYFIPVPGTPAMEQALKRGRILDGTVSNRNITYVDDQLTVELLHKYAKLIQKAADR